MKFQEAQRLLSRYLPVLLFSITIIVTPWLSSDPINTPKFLLLSIAGAICSGLLIQNFRVLRGSNLESKILLVLCAFFVFGLLTSFFSSNLDWREQFFGVSGRNTGLLSYLSLVSILFAVVFLYSSNLFSRFLLMLVAAGLVSGAYGLLQLLSLDPINWQNPYNPVIGFLGNPNFQSSFLGISTVALFSYTITSSSRLSFRVFTGLGMVVNSVVIYKSDSQQGALVLILGISLVTLGNLYTSPSKIYFRLYSVLFPLGIFIGMMGILEKGPLASILYKPSVTFRGDYWRAGFKMFSENILTGLGIDSYGSYYRQYRDLAAVTRRGPEITSNAAHNVVIDLAANGGLLLVIPYLLLIIFTIWIFIRAMRVQSDNKSLILVFALWVCYQSQSIISINQLALAAWGWVLMGLTIAISLNTLIKTDQSAENKKLSKSKAPQNQTSASTVLLVFLSLVVGISLGALPLNASAKQKSAIMSGKTDSVIAAAYSNPLDPNRMNVLAAILANYSYPDEALKLSKKTVEIFPLSYDAWRIISQLDTASSSEKAKALQAMRRLDPLNETIGK